MVEAEPGNPLDQRVLYQECRMTGWDPADMNTFAEELAHLHEEVSEAFRAWRQFHDAEIHYDGTKPVGVPIELADVLIGLFYNAERMGFDLWEATQVKHDYNLTRNYLSEGRQLHVPEDRRGGSIALACDQCDHQAVSIRDVADHDCGELNAWYYTGQADPEGPAKGPDL